MSAAATAFASLSSSTPGAAAGVSSGASPMSGGELSAGMVDPATAFQLLIAGLEPAPPVDMAPAALTTNADNGDLGSRRQSTGDAAAGSDLSLLEAMAALCAWQLPATSVPTPGTSAGDSETGVDPESAPLGLAVVTTGGHAAAMTNVPGDASAEDGALPSPVLPGTGDSGKTSLAVTDRNAAQPSLQSAATAEQPTAITTPQLSEMLASAATAATPTTRQKAAASAVETLLSQVDAASGGGLLRMPVVSSSVTRTVAVPMHDPRWPEAVATQVRWAVADGVQSATLKMVPEHLGPVELHIELKDNQVNVNFGATQSDTRQALQDSLPRLREILAGAGITLGQANVQQHSGRTSQSAAHGSRLTRDEAPEEAVTHTRMALGMIDLYA